jgi:hypothetical protein
VKTKRKAEIIFEADRTIVYAARYPRHLQWCQSCGAEVEMISVFDAARIAGVSSHTVYGWVESGRLHQGESAAGALLICPNALPE